MSFLVIWFIGRRLAARSSLMRAAMIVLSVVLGLLNALGTARLGWAFLTEWSFQFLVAALFTGGSVLMYIKSFRVLSDSQVKAYFG